MPAREVRAGLIGFGTIGTGVVKLLQKRRAAIDARLGAQLRLVRIADVDTTRDRGVRLPKGMLVPDAAQVYGADDIDVVIELMGGYEPARRFVLAAIASGKSIVTANKALLAVHGREILRAAADRRVDVGLEASVGGGIPIVRVLRDAIVADRVRGVYGIVNGTCNHILTAMTRDGAQFADALADAQSRGLAEADPSFDIDGVDAAHKLAILASVAFGRPVDLAGVHTEGIRHISRLDIDFAEELGYRIKLLGIARPTAFGIEQRVHACMVPLGTPIAHVEGVYNAVVTEGDFVGQNICEGRGAGAGPTASAVVSDLIDIARGRSQPTFSVPASELKRLPASPLARHRGAYYIRLMVVDKPGVIADVAAALRDEEVSMEAMIQRARAPGEAVPVVLTTHETEEAAMRRALARITQLGSVVEPPHMIRIESL
jgi:homoserine dehydrogenase